MNINTRTLNQRRSRSLTQVSGQIRRNGFHRPSQVSSKSPAIPRLVDGTVHHVPRLASSHNVLPLQEAAEAEPLHGDGQFHKVQMDPSLVNDEHTTSQLVISSLLSYNGYTIVYRGYSPPNTLEALHHEFVSRVLGVISRNVSLVSSKDGLPDALAAEMPSMFTKSIDENDLNTKYGGFGVLNRPKSIVEMVNTPEMMARIPEEYVFIAETDHVLFKDIPNLATETMPAGYKFGYMMKNTAFDQIIKRHWPQTDWEETGYGMKEVGGFSAKGRLKRLRSQTLLLLRVNSNPDDSHPPIPKQGRWDMTDQTGPSPLIIHKQQLIQVLNHTFLGPHGIALSVKP
eukprot:1194186-Prorocentrum_minimum.AAC.2